MLLKINEIFHSIQGESSYAGQPCVFIRLTGCNLRCIWCDTEYAFYEGEDLSLVEILEKVNALNCDLVEVTGGEPLMQESVLALMRALINEGKTVLLETGGSLPIMDVPRQVIKIVDFKCPGSGMDKNNNWRILEDLSGHDELKFVVADRLDFDWALRNVIEKQLADRFTVWFSPVFGKLAYKDLAEWILESQLPIRFQSQLHKHIWDPDAQGV